MWTADGKKMRIITTLGVHWGRPCLTCGRRFPRNWSGGQIRCCPHHLTLTIRWKKWIWFTFRKVSITTACKKCHKYINKTFTSSPRLTWLREHVHGRQHNSSFRSSIWERPAGYSVLIWRTKSAPLWWAGFDSGVKRDILLGMWKNCSKDGNLIRSSR